MNTYVNLWRYLVEFFSKWEFIQRNGVEKVKTHILCSIFFFEIRAFYEIMWQNMEEDYSYNVAHASYMATSSQSDYVIRIAFQQHLV
jgi:hypothetical protein